ncbi:hypothetical protein C623_0232840 [Bacillus thuringiensis serovar aizawai str. Hu4-2]|nr:hypothetical protein C623_0232840 [Bacillus thuringiensis serovar aizawai str. Hu4-2]
MFVKKSRGAEKVTCYSNKQVKVENFSHFFKKHLGQAHKNICFGVKNLL